MGSGAARPASPGSFQAGGPFPRVVPFGEAAFLVELGDVVEVGVNVRVHALAAAIEEARRAGNGGVLGATEPMVPGYASLLVPFDPAVADPDALHACLVGFARADALAPGRSTPAPDAREVAIPVRYGGDDGPDLGSVAAVTGLSPEQVIEVHVGRAYHVFMLGFAPGFAYLGPLAPELELPRRAEPRIRVPAGSVAIAGRQTAVYPHATPGGWHLIGRTDAALWDAASDPPALLRPGDRVRFVRA